ncbi:MAG: Class-II synthetase family, partial [Actinomycetia bacterium]|nr:Class-II synthetase family [Actinomycetes bacterium]
MTGLDSWREFPAVQQPDWPDLAELKAVTDELAQQPP